MLMTMIVTVITCEMLIVKIMLTSIRSFVLTLWW
jgi:hypothetical protein